jgi:hypothetical protein
LNSWLFHETVFNGGTSAQSRDQFDGRGKVGVVREDDRGVAVFE